MKPNIIVFMTDQQNASTMYKESQAITPNIDAFLEESMHFTEAYCPSPHCCPSRATFFSGMYPSQHGVWNNVEVDSTLSRGLYDDVKLLPEYLKDDGYQTIFAGKWHVSAYDGPEDRGFNKILTEYISNYGRMQKENVPKHNDWDKLYTSNNEMDREDTQKDFGRIIRPGYPKYYQFGISNNPYGDSTTVELACKEIENYDEEKPFFMYIGTTGPHDPYIPPQQFLDLYDIEDIELPKNFEDDMFDKPALYRRTKSQFDLTVEEHKESIRRYLAFVSYEDYLFGKVWESINKKGIKDTTIVIYLTDHGDYVGAHGLWTKGLPCFREAYNISAAVYGNDFLKGVKNNSFVSLADFTPTILDIVGVNPKKDRDMVGKSLVDVLTGKQEKLDRTEMYTQTNGNEIYGIQRSVWNEKWKYTYNSFDYDELYDLENDPYEMQNLISDPKYEKIIKQMCKKMWQFAYETKDNCTCGYITVSLPPYGPGIIFE